MGINVGDVETVLSARDTMSPTLVAAAERVAELRLRLAALGSTSTAVAAEIKMSLAQAEEAFKTLAAAATGQTTPAIAATAAGATAMNAALKGVKIGGDDASAGLKKTAEDAETAGRTLDQTAGMAQRLVERLAILYAIRGVFQFTRDLFESADALVKMSSSTDLTIGKLQEIEYTANQTGIPFTKVTTAIDTMDKKMAEAKASTGDALIGIGLSFGQLFDLNPDQRFDTIVASIAALPTQLQRTKAEVEIFGSDAIDPMVKRFGELSEAAHRNNAIMGDETVNALANTVKMYRGLWGDLSPIMGNIIDKSQKVTEILFAPFFGGATDPRRSEMIRALIEGGVGGMADIGALLARGGAPRTTDIVLPKPSEGPQPNTPLTGQAFIDSLYSQSLAVKSLTGEQWVQLQQLRDLNLLTVDNAAKIGVSTVQFKGYEDAIRQWDKQATAGIATQKEWDRARDNMLATGLDLDTAAPIDFLRAGASAKDIQTYYGMAASQVRQLQMDIRAESKEETEAARERERAQQQTDAAISRTGQLWDQYGQLTARVDDGVLASRLASVDTWYNHEVDKLNKLTVTEEAYYAQLDALAAVAGAKRAKFINDQNDIDERSLGKLTVEWDQYYQVIEKGTGTATSIQIAEVQRWFDNEVSRIKDSDTYWQQHYNILWSTAQAKMDLIIHAQDPLWLAWRGLNQDMRVEWAKTWDDALMGTGSFADALLAPFRTIEHHFSQMLAGMIANWEQSLLSPITNSANQIMGGMFVPGGGGGGAGGSGLGANVGQGMTFTSTTAAEDMLQSTATAGFMGAITGGSGMMGGAAAGATVAGTAATAAVTAGIAIAIAGGVALFKYIFRDKLPEDVARDAGEKFGQKWSDGLSKTVADNAKKFHDEVAGELMSLPAIIGEIPINDSNVFMYERRVHDLFSMIETGHLTAVDAVTTLDKVFPDLAEHATDAYGRISDELREIISLNTIFGTQSKAIAEWQKAQAANISVGFVAVTGSEASQFEEFARIKKAIDDAVDAASDSTLTDKIAVLAGKVDDAQAAYNKLVAGGKGTPAQVAAAQSKIDIARRNLEAANPDINVAMGQQAAAAAANAPMLADLGIQAVGTYVTSLATGSTPAEALKEIGPALTQIKKAYDDLGLSVDDVALANLLMQNTVLQGNPVLIAGVEGLSKQVVGLDNLHLETIELFAAQQRTGEGMYTRLQAAVAAVGGTTKDALIPMQGWLHNALIESEKLNIPLDDMTQMMIDQSKDAGVWQDNIKPTPTLIGVMGDLRDTVKELVEYLTGKMPKQIDIGVNFHTNNPEPPTPGGNTGEPPPPLASGGYITRGGLVKVHQDEAVISASAVARITQGGTIGAINAGRSTGAGMRAGIGQLIVNVYPPSGADMSDPDAVAAAWMIALREDRQLAYTAVQIIAQRTINEQPVLS